MDAPNIFKPSRFVFPLACLAVVTMLFISEGSYWQSVGKLDKLGSFGVAGTNIVDLQRGILDAETGQRGYLLTNRSEHLLPYNRAIKEIQESFGSLNLYYRNEPVPLAVLNRLQTLTEQKLLELALTIRQRDQGESIAEAVVGDIDRKKMDAIRMLGAELLSYEALKGQASRDDIYRTLMISRIGMAALIVLSLLAILMYLRQTLAFKRNQLELQRVVLVDRDRLEIEVVQRTAQLSELTQHLLTAREDERSRLARNLHDDLGALLTSAKLDAARIKPRLVAKAPEALELLAHLVNTLNACIALGRRIIEDLRPSALSNLGLVATLDILGHEFSEHSKVEVHCELNPVELTQAAQLMVYRLVQEAITNITKYAKARHVWIDLRARNGLVEVSVRDDGVGFDTSLASRSAYGLVGMRFRVEVEGGNLTVVSAPGQGTMIRATLPESRGTTTAQDLTRH